MPVISDKSSTILISIVALVAIVAIVTLANTRSASFMLSDSETVAGNAVEAPVQQLSREKKAGDIIPDQYIITFKEGSKRIPGLAKKLASESGGELFYTYDNVISGFAIKNLPPQAREALLRNPHVESIEPDTVVTVAAGTQVPPSWGLDRVDQRAMPLDSSYSYSLDGTGVNVYIIDTGVRITHSEFGNRGRSGFTAIADGQGTNDCNGHGTHVAGTIGGSTVGVAKNANIYAVRVLDCAGSGSWSGVIAGIDWVAKSGPRPAVASLSLGGGFSSAVNLAVLNAHKAGVTMVVAAGNSAADACGTSPASTPEAITVGASESGDNFAGYSNYGGCVDIIAPGSGIYSAYGSDDAAYASLSGTSMAAPHVSGVAALYLSQNPGATPAAVAQALMADATPGAVTSVPSATPNLLLYNLNGATPPPPDTVAPSTPTGLQGTATASSVNLIWTASSDNVAVGSYRVYRNGAQVGTASSPSYADNSVAAASSYTYAVDAVDLSNNPSGESSPVSVTIPVAPMSVSSLTASSITKTSAVITWSPTRPAAAIVSYAPLVKGRTGAQQQVSVPLGITTVTLTGLSARTTYSYTVTATSSANEVASATASFKTAR